MEQQPRLGFEIMRLSNMIRRLADSSTDVQKLQKITGANGWILCYLAERQGRDIYQKDVEEHFGVTRSTVSKVITLMEEKGLLCRTPVPGDGRLRRLQLTELGWQVHRLASQGSEQLERQIAAGFSPQELQQLCAFLGRIEANLDG